MWTAANGSGRVKTSRFIRSSVLRAHRAERRGGRVLVGREQGGESGRREDGPAATTGSGRGVSITCEVKGQRVELRNVPVNFILLIIGLRQRWQNDKSQHAPPQIRRALALLCVDQREREH